MERGEAAVTGVTDGWHSEVGGSAAAVALNASVEAGEFAFSGFQADLKALDFAEPAVHPCFGDALAQVVGNLGEACRKAAYAQLRITQRCS